MSISNDTVKVDELANPVFPADLTAGMLKGFVTTEHGCTHPRVGRIGGRTYIAKCGSWSDYSSDAHVHNEVVADELLRVSGLNVPPSREYSVDFGDGKGPQTVRLAVYDQTLVPLMEFWHAADAAQRTRIRQQVIGAYPVQALIAGIDTFTWDNVRVDAKGSLWFVDNGASFDFRACGKRKGWFWTRNDVHDVRTGYLSLAHHHHQLDLKRILGGLSDDELIDALRASDPVAWVARLPEDYRRPELVRYAEALANLEVKDPARTEIVFIVDRSGSMGGCEADVIGGFNRMLADQRQKAGECTVSTVLFDHAAEILHDRVPIAEVRPMTEEAYVVRGSTAYYDALGRAILHHVHVQRKLPAERRAERVLFVVMTDGAENASREFNAAQLKRLITHEQERWGWEFVFIGAGIDAIQAAAGIGIRADRAINTVADGAGAAMSWDCVNAAVTNLRARRDMARNADGSAYRDRIDLDYRFRGGR